MLYQAGLFRILSVLGVQLHPEETRVVHVRRGFEFLGYLMRRGKQLKLPPGKIVTGARSGALYAYPREKSVQRFKDRVRQLTRRCVPLKTKDLIEQLNPVLRGWGHYYKRAHVRTLFNNLDRWIERRIWSHRYKCWRNCGWKQLPKAKMYGGDWVGQAGKKDPSLESAQKKASGKSGGGKPANNCWRGT